MTDSLSDIRSRIHQKSQDYFTFAYRRRGKPQWCMFYGATDALLDASMAASSFAQAVTGETGTNLLVCYGFLQALYIQQDAVSIISRSIGIDWHPNTDPRIRQIRDIRNRLTGHPAFAGDKGKAVRQSSGIVSYDISATGFSGSIYFQDGFEKVDVDVLAVRQDNERLLGDQLRIVEAAMDNIERKFRVEQVKSLFSDSFGRGFDYLVEKLVCDLTDESKVAQALTHVRMIRDILNRLKASIEDRGFDYDQAKHHFAILNIGFDLLTELLSKKNADPSDQYKLYLYFDGIEKNLRDLKSLISEIDERLSTPV
jgi:hypothetical protein